MTLPFNENIINSQEFNTFNFNHPNFIGFLNRYGEIIDYSKPFGLGGHNINPSTELVLHYFPMLNGYFISNLAQDKEHTILFRNILKEELIKDSQIKYTHNRYTSLDKDLLLFFYRCYSNDTFEKGLGKKIDVLFSNEYFEKYCKYNKIYIPTKEDLTSDYIKHNQYKIKLDYLFYKLQLLIKNEYNSRLSIEEYFNKYCKSKDKYYPKNNELTTDFLEKRDWYLSIDYNYYLSSLVIDWFKTILIQYLHYHYVSRIGLDIYTSSFTPNETFYNYKLYGYNIYSLPKMIWNEDKKQYEEIKQNDFFTKEREQILNDEIESIKRKVPLQERKKYFK